MYSKLGIHSSAKQVYGAEISIISHTKQTHHT
jgi:hypothetical protein